MGTITCNVCDISGQIRVKESYSCTGCGGYGYIHGSHNRKVTCDRCNGRGTLEREVYKLCNTCNGTKKIGSTSSNTNRSTSSGGHSDSGGICSFVFLAIITTFTFCLVLIFRI